MNVFSGLNLATLGLSAYLGLIASTSLAVTTDADQQARYYKLLEEIRCLVCQNQSLADSNAELAQDLREEVARMMQQGASDDDIIEFLHVRYGDFVLYRPPLKPTTYLLWFGPLCLIVIAATVLLLRIRTQARRQETPLSQQQITQLDSLENNSLGDPQE